MSSLTIYKSSAGSGKTFTLVLNYLKLLLANPNKYRHILAITFTNKATREMKERIIAQLADMADGKQSKMTAMIEQDEELNSRQQLDWQIQAKSALTLILHDYARFKVSTIDSFFHNVIRSFARELNLPQNFEIELDQAEVLKVISDQIMLEIGKDASLTRWLRNYSISKMEEDKGWDVQRDIGELGRELFSEQFQKIQDQVFNQEKAIRTAFEDLLKAVNEIVSNYQKTATDYAREVLELIKAHGLEPANFKNGAKSGLIGDFQKLIDQNNVAKLENFYNKFQKVEGPEGLASKNSEFKEKILQCAESGLWDLLEEVVRFYEDQYRTYQTAVSVKKNLYAFGILSDLGDKLRDYRREHESLMISDMNNLLRQVTTDTDVPFIYEKVGNNFQHFLIDEFQDTSDFQWDNLRPLLTNALAGEQFSMVVGDVKQSIYRWRGGNPWLLMDKIFRDFSHYQEMLSEKALNVNYRSHTQIVRFNNAFFGHAAKLIAEATAIPNGHLLEQAYEDVTQTPFNPQDEQGHVAIEFLEADEEKPYGEMAREKMVDQLEEVLSEGYEYQDIAILVRTNLEAKRTANFLNAQETPYPVISSDSLVLGYSTKVKFLVNLLEYLNDPGNQMVKTRLINDYMRYLTNSGSHQLHELFGHTAKADEKLFEEVMPEAFFNRIPAIARLSLYEMTEELIDIFGFDQAGDAYLQRFLDQVLDYSEKYRIDIPDFIEWWREKGKNEAVQVPAEANAIRIETVHRAKGLEYPVVMVPYGKWELGHSGGLNQKLLWVQANTQPFDQIPYLPVNLQKDLANTLFQEDYYDDLLLSYLDNLNLLYVTFTRAIDQLFIWAPDPRNKDGKINLNSVNALLFQVLEAGGYKEELDLSAHWDDENARFATGTKPVTISSDSSENQAVHQIPAIPSNHWRNKLTIRPMAQQLMREERANPASVNHGLLIHGILEQMRTKHDLEPVLERFYNEGLFSQTEKSEIREKLEAVLKLPEVKEWFSKGWQVFNEREILMPDGTTYRPDRVITDGQLAKVAEFKTGKPEQNHQNQAKAYVKALEALGYEEVKGYLLYIEDQTIQEIAVED